MRRLAAACLGLLLVAGAALADPGAGRVRGVVLRGAEEDERPDAGRTVTLLRAGAAPATTKTDAFGAFSFDGVPAGATCEVRVEAEGCAPVRVPDVVLLSGDAWDVGVLHLLPPAAIDVYVGDEQGRPLAGAVVEAYRDVVAGALGEDRAHARLGEPRTPVFAETTGPTGLVRLAVGNLASWTVSARVEGRARDARAGIELWGDWPRFVELSLPKAERLTGVVRDDDGRPTAGAALIARRRVEQWSRCGNTPLDESAALWQRAVADEAGRFAFETLPFGTIDILAARPGRPPEFAARVEFPTIRAVAVALPSTASAAGRVVDADDGSPVAGVVVAARSAWSSSLTVTDADGRWRIDGLAADATLDVSADLPDGWTAFCAASGDRRRPAVGEVARIDATARRAATVHGRVTTGGVPVAGAVVQVVTLREDADGPRARTSARADENGVFRATDVAPGLVAVFASPPNAETGAEWNAFWGGVVRDVSGRAGVAFAATPGGAVERNVEIPRPRPKARESAASNSIFHVEPRAVVLKLRVATADGAPLVGGRWSYGRPPGEGRHGDVWRSVGADGTVEGRLLIWDGLDVAIYAWDERHAVAKRSVLVAGRELVEVEIVLPSGTALKGRVVADGKPVPGAEIRLDGVLVARAGDDGGFEVPWTQRTRVAVSADGFAPAAFERVRPEEGGVTLELRRAAAIDGVVVDEAGRPLAGLVVEALDAERRGVTDADGRFRLTRVPSGETTLRVSSPPGVSGVATTDSPSVAAGATDVRIVMRPERRVAGRILGRGGRPVGNTDVTIRPGPAGDEKAEVRTVEGRFAFPGMGEGEFTLTIAPCAADEVMPARRVVKGGEDVEIALEPMSEIRGVVVTESGGAPPRMAVKAVRLDPPEDAPEERFRLDDSTEKDGAFRIVVPPRARFRLVPESNSRVMIARLRGGEDVASGTTDLKLVADGGLAISGVVVDEAGRPLVGADLEAKLGSREYRRILTKAGGRFELGGMGECMAVLDVTLKGRVPFHRLVVSGTTDMTIALKPGKTITGRLLGADGGPAPNVWVRALSDAWPGADLWRAQPADDGRFEIDGLDDGEWRLEAFVPGCMTVDVRATFESRKAGETGVELRLPK